MARHVYRPGGSKVGAPKAASRRNIEKMARNNSRLSNVAPRKREKDSDVQHVELNVVDTGNEQHEAGGGENAESAVLLPADVSQLRSSIQSTVSKTDIAAREHSSNSAVVAGGESRRA